MQSVCHVRYISVFFCFASVLGCATENILEGVANEDSQADEVVFQLSDDDHSQVEAGLMLTSSYGRNESRLLLPGYVSEGSKPIYRSRTDDSVFVFYTVSGFSRKRYRVEQFDLEGNLIRTGRFHGETDGVPVTLVRVRNEKLQAQGGEYGVAVLMPDQTGITSDIAGKAYMTIDYAPDPEYADEYLQDRPRLYIIPIEFGITAHEGSGQISGISRIRSEVFVESLDSDIPFYRLRREGKEVPPYTP